MNTKRVKPNSFAWATPYRGRWVQKFFGQHCENLYGRKIQTESDLRERLMACPFLPEIMIVNNFGVDRAGILALCREAGINVVHGEDGFFPHYSTQHADPLGFCWESSLPRMVFRRCSDAQRDRAAKARANWTAFETQELPPEVRKPFVLWPLQLIRDRVNLWDLRVESWEGLLRHFRACLPPNYQLAIKEHPRNKIGDQPLRRLVRELPNTVLLPRQTHLKTLLRECSAVAGANSTVLHEGRLMFHKPTYVYARSWFTHHEELFFPAHRYRVRDLSRFEFVENNQAMRTERLDDYADWFLAQLLARQLDGEIARVNPMLYKEQVYRLSYHSFLQYGEEIFEP